MCINCTTYLRVHTMSNIDEIIIFFKKIWCIIFQNNVAKHVNKYLKYQVDHVNLWGSIIILKKNCKTSNKLGESFLITYQFGYLIIFLI